MPRLNHTYASILKNGDVLLQTSAHAEAEVYCAQQVQLFLAFDETLRELGGRKEFDPKKSPVPGGYDQFTFGWNLDTVSPYTFAQINMDTYEVTPLDEGKKPVPAEVLTPTLAGDGANDDKMSKDDKQLLRKLLIGAAEHEAYSREKARDAYQDRQGRRVKDARKKLYSQGMWALATSLEGDRVHGGYCPYRTRSASSTPSSSSSLYSRDIPRRDTTFSLVAVPLSPLVLTPQQPITEAAAITLALCRLSTPSAAPAPAPAPPRPPARPPVHQQAEGHGGFRPYPALARKHLPACSTRFQGSLNNQELERRNLSPQSAATPPSNTLLRQTLSSMQPVEPEPAPAPEPAPPAPPPSPASSDDELDLLAEGHEDVYECSLEAMLSGIEDVYCAQRDDYVSCSAPQSDHNGLCRAL
ncbi:hypothetical protein ACG7TL_007231 [Trametes sanguinea]